MTVRKSVLLMMKPTADTPLLPRLLPPAQGLRPAVSPALPACQTSPSDAVSIGAPLPAQSPSATLPAVAAKKAFTPPDVPAILANGKRFEDINYCITQTYADMAPVLQQIIDPSGRNEGPPNWYALAVYASRSAGQGMCVAHALSGALDTSANTMVAVLRFAFGQVPGPAALAAASVAAKAPLGQTDARAIAALARGSSRGLQELAKGVGPVDPRVAVSTSKRLGRLLRQAPGRTLRDKTEAVVNTMLTMLEEGNRAIFADMGAAGAAYLKFRAQRGGSVTPDEVVAQFSADGSRDPDKSRLVYDRALAQASGTAALPGDFSVEFPELASDSRPMFPAAFALYEQAGRTADTRVRDRLVMYANNLLAWREQHDVIQPCFDPPQVRPGEVRRMDIWKLMTPIVDIKSRDGAWRYADYMKNRDDDGDFSHLLTPEVLKKNWGTFGDRWPAILNAFDVMYAKGGVVWPMPDANPLVGLDAPQH